MISFGRPLVLLLGGAFALVPVVLHFLARRPPDRAPLPTTRFLSREMTSRVRLERRPTDLVRLALRVLFVVLLAGAFAAPRWSSRGGGTAVVVMLDGSAAMQRVWSEAIDSVRKHLGEARSGAPAKLIVFTRGEREVGTSAEVLDSLAGSPPSSVDTGVARGTGSPAAVGASPSPAGAGSPSDEAAGPANLRAALHALRDAGAAADADSVRAWIVFASRRGAWAPGTGEARASAWPGAIGVDALVAGATAGDSLDNRSSASATSVDSVDNRSSAPTTSVDSGRGRSALPTILAAASREDSVTLELALSAAPQSSAGAKVPVRVEVRPNANAASTPAAHPLIRFVDGWELHGARMNRVRSPPDAQARILAATGDGEPALVATIEPNSCVVTPAFDLTALLGAQPGSVPEVLSRMTRGCDPMGPSADADLPLHRGAIEVLRGSSVAVEGAAGSSTSGDGAEPLGADRGDGSATLPAAIPVSALARATGTPGIVRTLLLLALTLAAVEGYLSYGSYRPYGRRRAESTAPRSA